MAPTTFPRFLDLPYELRTSIYRLLEPRGRHLAIWCIAAVNLSTKYTVLSETTAHRYAFYITQQSFKIPVTLAICKESREDAQKRWTNLSGSYAGFLVNIKDDSGKSWLAEESVELNRRKEAEEKEERGGRFMLARDVEDIILKLPEEWPYQYHKRVNELSLK